jgi:hypothetical protein
MCATLRAGALLVFILSQGILHAQTPQGQGSQDSGRRNAVDFGFEERIRSENWNQIVDYSDRLYDERRQIRYRTRFWVSVPFGSHVDVFAALNDEFKHQPTPKLTFNADEVIIENLYLDLKNIFLKGLSLRIGRQNLSRGEGFVLMDGNPLDGSRSVYFNAFDLSYSFRKSNLEILGVLDPSHDRFLPVIHSEKKALAEWDEQALGLYYTDRNHPHTGIESYYLYKKEVHDTRSPASRQFQPDRHLSTAGVRVLRKLGRGFETTGEYAYQWGRQHPNTEIRGWGGYCYVKRPFENRFKPYLLGGIWALSGDDPQTSRIEGWDPLFSRWPRWSELYVYSQIHEKAVGYWTNTGLVQAEAGFSPAGPLDLRFTYYHMNAFHPFAGDPAIMGAGKRRGDLFEARADLKVSNSLKGHVLYENLMPGDFYSGGADGYFLRFELTWAFHRRIPLP